MTRLAPVRSIAVCATVLAISAAASAQPIIQPFHSFQPSTEGSQASELIQGSDGNFYGITQIDGTVFGGAIFKMTPAGVVTLLHEYGFQDGFRPSAPFVQGADGNFYATSPGGLFKMTPAGVVTTLHSLTGDDGSALSAPLIQAADGSFYGVTNWGGGAFGVGTAFRVASDGTFTVLHVFSGYPLEASSITAPLVQALDGSFVGISPWGGVFNQGTVFKMTPDGAVTVLHAFEGGSGGSQPNGPLLAASDGNFYGTVSGGAYGYGAIFRVAPDGTFALVYSFQGPSDGMVGPGGQLVQAADGNIYGTVTILGQSLGAVFRMTFGGGVSIFATGGSISNLLQAADGNFYGLGSGGFFNSGAVMRVASSAPAVMVSPKPATTLNQTSVMFNWSDGAGATSYRLDVGSSPGQHDLFGADLGLATSQVVSGLPLTHNTIYVRLSTRLGGNWQFYDYAYTATTDTTATITSPQPVRTTTISGSTVEFDWSPGSGAMEYWLEVGNALGGSNFYSASAGLGLSAVVNGLPNFDGSIYARLWTKESNGSWSYNDYAYLRFGPRAAMTFPQSGSWFPPVAPITFQWSSVPNAASYWLDVGTSVGMHDVYSHTAGLATSVTVSPLPFQSETVYVRLWTQVGSSWFYNDYQYFGFQGKASMVSPSPGSSPAGSSVTFTWWPPAIASAFWLEVGTAPGLHDLFGQNVGLATSQTVNGVPYLTRTIWARLWTQINGRWYYNDYAYPVVNHKATMTLPDPGSALTGTSATFSWGAIAGASQYWLEVGNSPGHGTYFEQSVGLATSQTVSGLPNVGGAISVRLWTLFNGSWLFNDYTYQAVDVRAAMTSPAPVPGAPLTATSVTFQWNAGAGATAYWLEVGTGPGRADLFGQIVGLATSQIVNGLPVDGSSIYVRLWSQINNGWFFHDYVYTAFNAKASMTSPAPSSIFAGTSVPFVWSAGTGATSYWLDVGTTPGGTNIFSQGVGLATNQTVNGLPASGAPIFVRLWTQLNTHWLFTDYQYVALSAKAVISAPTPGPVLTQPTVLFQWNAVPGASEYWLEVETTPGSSDVFTESTGTSTNQSVTGIPTKAPAIYVRLWTQFGGVWQYSDSVYNGHAITFDSATFNGWLFTTYSESTFTVNTGSVPWSFAVPTQGSPWAGLWSMLGVTTTGELTIVPTLPQFHFNSVDVRSDATDVPYEITGTGPGGTVFSWTGILPNPSGGFVHLTNPYAAAPIDQLSIKLTDPAPACCSNYVGVDNIMLSY